MSFPLAGNARIRTAVYTALRENRMPHAVLIEGEPGTGKHTLAAYLAQAAVCSSRDGEPCGVCRDCRLAEAGSHPDITTVTLEDRKKAITVAQIRALRSEAYVKPHMAGSRVFIIDAADTMNEQSQNAVLKILEEPPGSVLFLLIAESKAAFLETVLSRCVIFSLFAPGEDEALSVLREKTGADEQSIRQALQKTENNVGRALGLLAGHSGGETEQAAQAFIAALLNGDEYGMMSAAAPYEKKRIEAERFVRALKPAAESALRKNLRGASAKLLAAFYSELRGFEKSLAANINLSLLFCAMACRAAALEKQ